MKIRRLGAELFQTDGRTDGHRETDTTQEIVAFCIFANEPKKLYVSVSFCPVCAPTEYSIFIVTDSYS